MDFEKIINTCMPIAFRNSESSDYYLYIPKRKLPYFITDFFGKDYTYIGVQYKFRKSIRTSGYGTEIILLTNETTLKQIQLNLSVNPKLWKFEEQFFTKYNFLNSSEEWFNFYKQLQQST